MSATSVSRALPRALGERRLYSSSFERHSWLAFQMSSGIGCPCLVWRDFPVYAVVVARSGGQLQARPVFPAILEQFAGEVTFEHDDGPAGHASPFVPAKS